MSNKLKYSLQLIAVSTLILMVACKPNKNKAETKNPVIANLKSNQVEVINSNFIYEEAPFPSCHASSVVDLGNGRLMGTWFGGTEEKDPDVTIWTSIYQDEKWGDIKEVADGIRDKDLRYPCWNPVLFKHSSGLLYLFYKVGPSPREWWGEMISSEDDGENWSTPEKLPEDIMGPIRAKPIELGNGDLLCPSSWEYAHDNWKVHMELFKPDQNSWTKIPVDHESDLDVIQPTLLKHADGKLQILCRSQQNRVIESWSEDSGKTWGKLEMTNLPNPSAGIDGVTLPNGKHLLVYNPTEDGKHDRAKLNLAISSDGSQWSDIYEFENEEKGEFSYPAIIASDDSKLHVSYTWNRKKIKHIELELK